MANSRNTQFIFKMHVCDLFFVQAVYIIVWVTGLIHGMTLFALKWCFWRVRILKCKFDAGSLNMLKSLISAFFKWKSKCSCVNKEIKLYVEVAENSIKNEPSSH